MNICIFGDSITWGAYDSEHGGWAARLREWYAKQHDDVKVYSLGIFGNNTRDVVARFQSEAITRRADVIVFAIGINDSKYKVLEQNFTVPLEEFTQNILTLIKESQKITPKILFVGINRVGDKKAITVPIDFYDNEYIQMYDVVIQKVCQQEAVTYVAVDDLVHTEDLKDGIHPNTVGHQKIFDRVLTSVTGLIQPSL